MRVYSHSIAKRVPDLVDPALQGIGSDLSRFLRTLGISDDGPPDIHRNALSTFLRHHCQDILRVVAHARFTKQRSRKEKVPETYFRKYWDLLLEYCLYSIDDPSASISTL